MLAIDPDECIDCALCEPECPVDAIVADDDLAEDEQHYIELNARLAKKWPNINEVKPAPDDADDWADVKDKLQYLEE
jgi:ferredoxin